MSGPYHVTNVTFHIAGAHVSVQEAPYQIPWTADENWFYLTVVAEADSGAIGQVQEFFTPERLVSLAFATPGTNKPVIAGTPVSIQLTVNDPGHLIAIYEYSVNGQLLI